MKMKRILCPIDFSRYTNVANFASSLFAQESGAEIVYLHIARAPIVDSSFEGELTAIRKSLAESTKPVIQGIPHRHEVRFGNPATEIIRTAEDMKVDLIVIGTHGRSGSNRLVHGSVFEHVLREAECPVMAVKPSLDVKSSTDTQTADR